LCAMLQVKKWKWGCRGCPNSGVLSCDRAHSILRSVDQHFNASNPGCPQVLDEFIMLLIRRLVKQIGGCNAPSERFGMAHSERDVVAEVQHFLAATLEISSKL